jgi:valyl-tRNA synthetase
MRFVPENWRAEFLRWMNNIHDWTISRQLWWGHQIPAWYCEYGHVTVARERPTDCTECHSGRLTQDPDVLDTWFSSGLWPFSTFGWPEDTPALRTFYPNSVMETGFDILFFWVARMAMLGLHFMGELPFRTVFLHAMVRDEKGEKMSKTRGNVIDPLDLTARYGADALRFTLASMAGQGRDIKLSTERIAGHRAFANKIWNAARFVLMNAEGYDPQARPASVYDRWILSRFQRCADETRASLEQFQLSDAANGIYRFIWNELCDWAIELSKPALYGEKTPEERAGAQTALLTALEGALRLLHPFMPFLTEEIWQRLPNRSGRTIMLAPFPGPGSRDEEAEREMDAISRAIDGARSVRGEVNLPPNQKIPLVLFAKDRELFQRHERAFQHLANASEVTLRGFDEPRPRQAAVHVEPEVEVHLPLAGLIDFAAESARVEKEIARTEAELQGLRKRLDNAGFVARAPREVVEKDRARADELAGKREKLARHLARVTSVEGPMEDKYPQQPKGDGSSGEQGSPSGTPGGQPKSQPPQQKSQPPQPKSQPPQPRSQPPPPRSQPPAPGGEGMGSGRETSGMPELARDMEKMAERAVERVKSIARGLMEKLPADLPGMGGESDQGARAPKRAPARKAKPKKAKGGTKGRAKAARGAKKSARSAGSGKKKAGKGARAKSGAKRRPSRKGKK